MPTPMEIALGTNAGNPYIVGAGAGLPVTNYSGGGAVTGSNPLPVSSSTGYKYVAPSAANTLLGASGALGDFLSGVLIVPATTSPGAVSVTDGNGGAMTLFTGGASSVATLHSFFVPFPAKSTVATTPGWRLSTGSNVAAIAFGTFT